MVRKEPIPILVVIVPALISIYFGSAVGIFHFFIPMFIVILFFSLFLNLTLFFPTHHILYKNTLFLLGGLLIGASVLFSIQIYNRPLRTLATRGSISALTGELRTDPVPAGPEYYRASFKVEQAHTRAGGKYSARGTIALFFPREYILQSFPGGRTDITNPGNILARGLTVTVPGTLATLNKGQQDRFYFTYFPEKGKTLTVNWESSIARLRTGLRFSLIKILYDWKEPGGLLLALLSSNRDYISSNLAAAFKNAGLSHILALSGMHLSIIAALALGIGIGTGGKKFAVRFSLFVITIFVWFAGNSPSLDRALIMALAAAIFTKLGVPIQIVPLLAFSCLVQILVSPNDTLTLAFKLSYTALAGIVLLGRWISYSLEALIPRKLSSSIAASISAQIFTAPIVSNSIGVLAPIGIIAACVTGPIVTLYLIIGIILLALVLPFPFLSNIFFHFYTLLYRILEGVVLWFSHFPKILIQDLSAVLVTSILSISVILFMYILYFHISSRRAPDVLFSRL